MKPVPNHSLVPSSLMDRLRDDDTRRTVEAQVETHYDLSGYKRAVAWDLEALLNTRCVVMASELLESFPLARASMLSFGITDLSSLSLLNPDDRAFLGESIRMTIERHEPRLDRVRVGLALERDARQMLKFRVDALLKVHPSRPPVTFDALLQLSSNTYEVKG